MEFVIVGGILFLVLVCVGTLAALLRVIGERDAYKRGRKYHVNRVCELAVELDESQQEVEDLQARLDVVAIIAAHTPEEVEAIAREHGITYKVTL